MLVELALRLGRLGLSLLAIAVLSRFAVRILGIAVHEVLQKKHRAFAKVDEGRLKTLEALLRSIAGYVVYFIAIVMALDQLGLDTGSLIAAAGVSGLAIGFGAQNLVRDLVTGFFILFDGYFVVGDFVTLGNVSGVVEEMGIRTTKLRDFGGELHIVPNGEVGRVTNHMGSSMRVMVDVDIAYEVDLDYAIEVLEKLSLDLKQELPDLLEGPSVQGVVELGDSGVQLRVVARARKMTQWSMAREIRKRIKKTFDERGIEIPYPRRYLVFDKSATKDGGSFSGRDHSDYNT